MWLLTRGDNATARTLINLESAAFRFVTVGDHLADLQNRFGNESESYLSQQSASQEVGLAADDMLFGLFPPQGEMLIVGIVRAGEHLHGDAALYERYVLDKIREGENLLDVQHMQGQVRLWMPQRTEIEVSDEVTV